MLASIIDLPLEKECRITLGDASWNLPASQNIVSSLPVSPLTRGASAPMVAGRSTIKFGQAMIWPITFMQPAMDYPFFRKPASTHVSMPQKVWGTPSACSSLFVEGIPYVTSGYSGSHQILQLIHRCLSRMRVVMMMMMMMMMMKCLPLIGWAHPTQRASAKAPNSESHPPATESTD